MIACEQTHQECLNPSAFLVFKSSGMKMVYDGMKPAIPKKKAVPRPTARPTMRAKSVTMSTKLWDWLQQRADTSEVYAGNVSMVVRRAVMDFMAAEREKATAPDTYQSTPLNVQALSAVTNATK